MGDSKKILEFSRLVAVADNVACYAVYNGIDYHFYLSDLLTYIDTSLNGQGAITCIAGETTNINLGAALDNQRIEISYIAKRGTKYRLSTIVIINNGSSIYLSEYPYITIPESETEDLGTTFACDINSSQARLNVTVDNASADNVTFKYTLKTMDL
jgi:hypothetical protein